MTTLVDYLEDVAKNSAESTAYIWQDQPFSYSSLTEDINQAAGTLESLGIQKGDRVALLLGNSPEFVISYYSILRIGAAVVPMNPMYTASELEFILSNSGAKAIVGIGKMKDPLLQAKDKLSSLDHVILTGEGSDSSSSYIPFSSLLDNNQAPLGSVSLTKEDTAVILYTSGTTGRPKGAILTHENVLSNALATAEAMEYEEKDVSMAVLPMFHVFCMTVSMNASLIKGVPIVIMPAFSPKETVTAIQKHQVTLFAGYQRCTTLLIRCLILEKKSFPPSASVFPAVLPCPLNFSNVSRSDLMSLFLKATASRKVHRSPPLIP